MSTPVISIVIVNFNGAGVLRDCLSSVIAQSYKPIEVIVVDNGSTDDSVTIVKKEFLHVTLILNSTNRGFASANNQGVAAARGEYVVLLNNDTVVTECWLPGLLEMMSQPNIGVVTSKVITDGVSEKFYAMNGTINYSGYNIMCEFSDLSQVFFAGGASLMFRRNEVLVPFLDEYFIYHEDVFLSWMMRLQNREVRMAQNSVVYHRGSVTTKRQNSSLVTFYQERNRLLNCMLFYGERTLVLLLPFFVFDAAAKAILSAVAGRKSFGGIIRSYWWLMWNVRWLCSARRRIQALRKVSDRDIMCFMSAKIVDSDSPCARMLNSVSRTYASLAGLASHE